MLKKKSILAIAAAGVALMAVAGYASADVVATNTATTTASQTSTTHQAHHKGQFNNQQLLTLLKIDATTLQQDFKAGQSIADIASTQGVNEQDVINLLVQQSTDRINKAVAAGKLTQDKATQRESKLADQVKKMVEHKGGFAHKRNGQGQLKQVASVLGIDSTQLMTQVKAGQSIADIAAAQGKDEQTVINALVTQATTKINAAVQVGKLTQDKATKIESKLPDRIKKFVERKGFGKQHNAQQASQSTSTPTSIPTSTTPVATN